MTTPANNSPTFQLGRLALFGGAALCLGIAAADAWHGNKVETVTAVLEARRTAVVAGNDCTLAEIMELTGSRVEPGQPLLRLSDDRLEAQLLAKRRELQLAAAECDRAQAAAEVEIAWRKRDLQREVYQSQLEATRLEQERLSRQVEQIAWQEHLQTVEHWLDRSTMEASLRPVVPLSSRPDSQRLQALLKEDAAATASETLTRQLTLVNSRLQELQQMDQALEANVRVSAGVAVAANRKTQIEAEIERLEAQTAALTIRSPGCGVVGVWTRQPGDRVIAGENLVELLDDAQLSLTAMVPSARIGRMKPEQRVPLQFPGQQRRTGVVAELPPEVSTPATSDDDATIRVRVKPAGKLWPKLPIGSRVVLELPAA